MPQQSDTKPSDATLGVVCGLKARSLLRLLTFAREDASVRVLTLSVRARKTTPALPKLGCVESISSQSELFGGEGC